jgi:hypothetical protein
MKRVIVNVLIIPLCMLLKSCNSVEPPPNGNGQDTTSHNFIFQTWTFGKHSSSVLYDVAIIDENDIWAVGEIYLNDSLGQPDPQAYGAAHWDGSEWNLMKVSYHDFNQTVKYPGPLFTVTEIDREIYVVSYANLLKWTGTDWEEKAFFMEQILFDGQVIKIWGYNENRIYCVGRNGAIYYYFGTSWQKLESGTDLNIYDIWGDYNNESDEYEIIAVAANRSVSTEKQILKIINTTTVTPLVTEGIPYSIVDVWFEANRKYFVCGAGLFFKSNVEMNETWEELTVSNVYLESIDGEGLDDIVICGSFGELMHYNGSSWRRFEELPVGSLLLSIKIKGDIIVTVGIDNPKAFIAIGHR